MDKHYDIEKAAQCVEAIARGRAQAGNTFAARQISQFTKSANWQASVKVVEFADPKTWMLVYRGTPDTDVQGHEEVVLIFQGIITDKNLPPLVEKPSIPSHRFRFLRQGVTVTGLGGPSFADAEKGFFDIFALFSRSVEGRGAIEPLSRDTYLDFACLSASNRYFTPLRDASNAEEVEMEEMMDPHGHLRSMLGTEYVYTADNVVRYTERTVDTEGKIKNTRTSPSNFQVGDIVELQVTFMAVPMRGENKPIKMLTVLRSISLLSSTFSQEAASKRAKSRAVSAPTKKANKVKRNVGYDDEDEGQGDAKRANAPAPMETDGN